MTSELTPVIYEAFSLPELATANSKFPSIRVALVKKSPDATRGRGLAFDGKHSFPMILDGDKLLPDAGTIMELTHYSLHLMPGKPEDQSAQRPVVKVFSFLEGGQYDLAQVRNGNLTKLSDEIAKSASAKASAVGSGSSEPAPVATRPNPATVAKATKKSVNSAITSIESLTPYTNSWKIRARASQKSQIREYKNDRGEGKLFNVNFIDETGEIRCTAFTNEVTKFYDFIKEGRIYYVSQCSVRPANTKYSNVKNDFELTMRSETEIVPTEEESDIPAVIHSFVEFEKLENVAVDSNIDVIGVIQNIDEPSRIVAKSSGRPFDKREIILVDKSGLQVRTTMWGQEALDFAGNVEDVLAIKGARVGEFNNAKNLSTIRTSLLSLNPDIREAHAVKGWYDAQGRTMDFKVAKSGSDTGVAKLGNVKLIKDVLDENLGHTEKTEYFTIKATVMQVFSRNMFYPACPNCSKKLTEESNGDWYCEKDQQKVAEPQYRYVLTAMVGDSVASPGLRVSMFDEAGKIILGREASELAALNGDEEQTKPILDDAQGAEYYFRCKTRLEEYQGKESVRYQCLSAISVASRVAEDTAEMLSGMSL